MSAAGAISRRSRWHGHLQGGEAIFELTPSEADGARGWTRALLIVGTGTMTAAWLSSWVMWLARTAPTMAALPGPALEAIVLGGAVLARRLVVGALGERWIRALFTLSALLAALIAVWACFYRTWLPIDPRWLARLGGAFSAAGHTAPWPATGVVALVLWGMGGRIGASTLDEYAVFRFFAAGVAGLFGGIALATAAGATSTAALGTATALFFAAAFTTLPLAQLAGVRERGMARGAQPAPLDRRWGLGAAAATIVVLALALILSAAPSGALLGAIGDLLSRLLDLLAWILSPLFLLAGYLAQALADLIGPLHPRNKGVLPAPQPPRVKLRTQRLQRIGHAPPILHLIAEVAVLV
ncbi:MAG TPA: hypothetical protein VHB98_09200, partial [Chloroflexota bacterium]|nr:hypothetical protein [Chloroflexota bacterium]